jgi:hypothetical protein
MRHAHGKMPDERATVMNYARSEFERSDPMPAIAKAPWYGLARMQALQACALHVAYSALMCNRYRDVDKKNYQLIEHLLRKGAHRA